MLEIPSVAADVCYGGRQVLLGCVSHRDTQVFWESYMSREYSSVSGMLILCEKLKHLGDTGVERHSRGSDGVRNSNGRCHGNISQAQNQSSCSWSFFISRKEASKCLLSSG